MFSVNYERGNRAVAIQWDSRCPDKLVLTLYINYLDEFHEVLRESLSYSGPALPDVDSLQELDDGNIERVVGLSEHLFTAELPEEWKAL